MSAHSSEDFIVAGRQIVRRASSLGLWCYALLGLASLFHLVARPSVLPAFPWHILTLAYGWWVAIGFVLIQVALGRRLFGAWLTEAFGSDHPATNWLAQFTCGFWLSTVILMVLAQFGLLDRRGVGLYLLGSAILTVRPASPFWRSLRNRFRPIRDRKLMAATGLVLAVAILFLPFFIQSLLPNSDWDGASTHLPLADWFGSHGLTPIPLDHANLIAPGSVHLVYAAFMAIDAELAIIPLNLMVSLLTCLAAATVASRFWGPTSGIWTFFVCLSINLLMELGLDPRIDGFLALFCTVAALGTMVWLLEKWPRGALVLSTVGVGLALGTKYTAVFVALLWGIPVVWTLLRTPGSRSGHRKWGVVLAAVCLFVPSGYWYATNTFRFDDPIYPRLRGDLVELKDGRLVSLSESVDELIAAERTDDQGFLGALEQTVATPPQVEPPRTLFDPIGLFLHPQLYARKVAHTLSPLLLLFFLLPFFRRDRATWLLLGLGISVFVAIGARTGLMRYGLPFYPLFATGAGVVIASVRARWWQLLCATGLAGLIASNLVTEWHKLRQAPPWAWLRGEQDRIEWVRTAGYSGSDSVPMLIRTMGVLHEKGALPHDGAVMMLGESKTHLFPLDAIPDTSRTGHPWLARLVRHSGDLDAVHDELWSDGIRYVLLNMGYFEWVLETVRFDQEELVYSLFKLQQFQRAHGEIVFSGYGMYIIRLQPPAESTTS